MDTERPNAGFERLLRVLRRRGFWIVLCALVVAAAAYGYSKRETKKYTTAAVLTFNSDQLDQQIAGLSVNASGTPLEQQSGDIELVKYAGLARRTARLLGHGLTPVAVSRAIDIKGEGESNIVEVAATSTSPVLAAAIANVYAGQFVREQARTNRRQFRSALALVDKQLAALPPGERFGADALDLQNRAHTLELLAELDYKNVQVTQEAIVPAVPSSPSTHRNAILGGVLGLLLGLGIVFLLERFDHRIRDPEEFEAIYHAPTLGTVPKSRALALFGRDKRTGSDNLSPAEAEAFNLIRAHLKFLSSGLDVSTVIVASPASGDGKTTVAYHLADAAAKLGSRVLLLEADLRRPALTRRLGIEDGVGLVDVLIGRASSHEAIRSVNVGGAPGGAALAHSLDVLAAGSALPLSPGELLESPAMHSLLAQLKPAYDLVVVDTPQLTAVSDAFALLAKVDGVLIVGRVGHSRRGDAEQLQRTLAGSEAKLLGVVVNGVKSGSSSSYVEASARNSPTPASATPTGAAKTNEQLVS
jgi:succinoglycan biosynthesis transport protein ExoP